MLPKYIIRTILMLIFAPNVDRFFFNKTKCTDDEYQKQAHEITELFSKM